MRKFHCQMSQNKSANQHSPPSKVNIKQSFEHLHQPVMTTVCLGIDVFGPTGHRPPGYPKPTQDYGYDIASQAEREAPWTRRGSQQWGSGGPSYPFPANIPVTRGTLIMGMEEQLRRKPSGVSTNGEGAR